MGSQCQDCSYHLSCFNGRGTDLRRADTWQIEGREGKQQFLCRAIGILALSLLEGHPAYECAPSLHLSLRDTGHGEAATMLVAGSSPSLPLPPQASPLLPLPQLSCLPLTAERLILYRPGLVALSRASTWAEHPPFHSFGFSGQQVLGKAPENTAS